MKKKPVKKTIFILGGARSGKSTYAQKLATDSGGRVIFVATGQALDEEMEERIANHRRQRPKSWQTIECPSGIAAALKDQDHRDIVIIDCITLLISNIMGHSANLKVAEKKAAKEINDLIEVMSSSGADFILVSNEVGLGIVPENTMAREYRDLLGNVNQMLAAFASDVYLMTAGIPLKLK